MAAGRIRIFKKNYVLQSARQKETEPTLHYETWCEIGNLYGQELYEAESKQEGLMNGWKYHSRLKVWKKCSRQ